MNGAVDEAQASLGWARSLSEPSSRLYELLVTLERDLWVLMAEVATLPENRHKLSAEKSLVTPQMVDAPRSRDRRACPMRSRCPRNSSCPARTSSPRPSTWRAPSFDEPNASRSATPLEDSFVVAYLNRLSDLAWTMARFAEGPQHRTARIHTRRELHDPHRSNHYARRGAATRRPSSCRWSSTTGPRSSPSRCRSTLGGPEHPADALEGVVRATGLKPEPVASPCCARSSETNVVFVSLGSTTTLSSTTVSPAPPRRAQRGRGLASRSSCPPTASTTPRDAAQALVDGALLASYSYKQTRSDLDFRRRAAGRAACPRSRPTTRSPRASCVARSSPRASTGPSASSTPPPATCRPRNSPAGASATRGRRARRGRDVDRAADQRRTSRWTAWASARVRPSRLAWSTRPTTRTGAKLPHVALVGKGVTFDSGGLSIKTGEGMMTMKTDMTGAAVVMAALSIASRLELAVRVTAIAPMTENLPGDRATKPGDVLTIRNGMTIEVLNTDAEGRLILADGLSLAVEANPDAIIDVATLTGAQVGGPGRRSRRDVRVDRRTGRLLRARQRAKWRTVVADAAGGELRVPSRFRRGGHEEHRQGRVGWHDLGGTDACSGSPTGDPGRTWTSRVRARSDANRGYTTKGATAFSARTIVEFFERAVAASTRASSRLGLTTRVTRWARAARRARQRRGRRRRCRRRDRPAPTRTVLRPRSWPSAGSVRRGESCPRASPANPLSSSSNSSAIVAMAASVCQ